MKLLLIEDSPTHALLIRNAFEETALAEVRHVADAEMALAELGHDSFDAIIVDHYLPGMSGLDFVRTVRLRGLDTPIVMLTAQSHVEVAAECMKSGANDYLAKEEGYLTLLPRAVRQAYRHAQAERENRDLQRQLRLKVEELELSNKHLIEFQHQIVNAQKMNAIITLVRGICHELNNPLTGILGYSQLLQEVWRGEGLADLKEIESCAQRCRDIISTLAKFSRVERPVLEMVNVNEAIEESLGLLEYYATRYRAKLVSDLDARLPPTLANLQDLRQAFLAVFLNGVQAMSGRKGGTLSVKSFATDGLIYVVVNDNGEGIPPENLERIFLPFFTTRKPGEASGMGLAIAYGIMRDHEATILVDSTVGQGSTFSFVMPIRSKTSSEAEEAPTHLQV